MRWLEIIELRSAYCHCDLLRPLLQNFSEEMNTEAAKRSIATYNSLKSGADFSIHLVHNSKEAAYEGSPLGLQLAAALKTFGLVHHSIWVEMNTKQSKSDKQSKSNKQ